MKNQKASMVATSVAWIAIFLLVVIIVYEVFRTKPVSENAPVNMVKDPNFGLENMINDIYENVTNDFKNEEVNDTENQVSEEASKVKNETSMAHEVTLSKEEQVIQMAKEKYGEEDGIYFSVDAIDTEGRYIVSVHESETTIMITSYVVNLEKQTIVEQ